MSEPVTWAAARKNLAGQRFGKLHIDKSFKFSLEFLEISWIRRIGGMKINLKKILSVLQTVIAILEFIVKRSGEEE